MKLNITSLLLVGTILTVSGCDLFKIDNYDSPDATLKGSIIDQETGEKIQTDVINGTTLSLIEQGYENPSPQYLRVKNDGSYEKALLFPGKYLIQPTERNFYQLDTIEVKLKKGVNTLDFNTIPYVRVKDTKIEKQGNKIVASFKLEAPGGDPVKEIGLFAGPEGSVGESIYTVSSLSAVNRVPGTEDEFKVSIDCALNKTYLKPNHSYYFRAGARSSFKGAKFNYSTAVKLNIGEIEEVPEPDYFYFDRCESIDGWGPSEEWVLDDLDKTEGEACIKSRVNAGQVVFASKTLDNGIDAQVSRSTGYFALDIYISDASAVNWDNGDANIEISSSGKPDQQELAWPLRSSLRLTNGWNRLSLKLSEANATGGNIDLTKVNFIRIYHTDQPKEFVIKLDNIRFYEPL